MLVGAEPVEDLAVLQPQRAQLVLVGVGERAAYGGAHHEVQVRRDAASLHDLGQFV